MCTKLDDLFDNSLCYLQRTQDECSRHTSVGERNAQTRSAMQLLCSPLYIFKKKKINIWKFSPVGRGVNWKEQDWLLCRRRYEQLSNRGWDFFTQH